MLFKMNALLREKPLKNWFDMLLPIAIMIITVIFLPMGVLAEVGVPEVPEASSVSKVPAKSSVLKGPVLSAVSVTGGNAAAFGATGTAGDVAVTESGSAAAGQLDNEIAYRVKPLQDKLAAVTPDEIISAVNAYSDMDIHWGREEIGKLTCLEIIAGVNGAFLPDSPVQVDQFIKMAVRALGFTLVQDTKYWAQNYIDTAIEQKLIAQNEFQDYKRAITREEAARIIVKATLMKEEFPYKDPYNNPDNLVRSKILDYSKIEDANKQFVLQSYEIGLIQGSNGRFMPGNTLTRTEAATIIIRYLDTASRVPFKSAEGEIFTCVNPDGTVVTAYPPPKMEVIEAANAFEAAWPKSKGWVWRGFSEEDHVIMYVFYESKEIHDKDSGKMHMGIDLDTINDVRLMDTPYDITIYDAVAVKKLHRDVIYEMFKFWFEKDVDKAMAEFDKYLDYAISGDQEHRIDKITYNKRLMFFYKIGGDDGFSLTINSQP